MGPSSICQKITALAVLVHRATGREGEKDVTKQYIDTPDREVWGEGGTQMIDDWNALSDAEKNEAQEHLGRKTVQSPVLVTGSGLLVLRSELRHF